MINREHVRTTAIALSLAASTSCVGQIESDDQSAGLVRQSFVQTSNGLRTINGLRTLNGLISVNGLTTQNGLRTINGFRTLNGLRTLNGFRTFNGLEIDCTDGALGESCTGEPDGLLSNQTGLMASEGGVETASFLIRCALPAGDAITVKDHTGSLVTLPGELGLTPEWKDGQCDATCQERISACLMAFTNGDGVHVELEMSAPFTLGLGHSRDFPFQEAAFFGNIFTDPPQAYYCVGEDYATSGFHVRLLETRACEGYNEETGVCPYKWVGYCGTAFSLGLGDNTVLGDEKCRFAAASTFGRTGDTAASCKSGSGFAAKSWQNPITTFRAVRE